MVESTIESRAEMVLDSFEKSEIRVLHVDDELEFLKVAKQCLEVQGPFQVDSASSVEEALEKLKKESYDAVISDYQMPGKDGLQFLRELRANRNGIPFIIFTGKGREEVAIEALNLGANQYLNKTGDPATVYCELAHGIRQAVEKNKTEEELKRFSSAVKSSFDGVVICDMSRRIIEVNSAVARIYGSTDENELIGKNSLDLLAPEERDSAMEGFKELLKEGSRTSRGYTAITKSGNRLPVEISVTLMKNGEGKPIGFVCIIRDTTERRKAEERYKVLVEQSLEGIGIAQGVPPRLVFANPAMAKLSGYTREELASVPMDRLIHPDDRSVFFSRLKDRLEGKKVPSHNEYRAIRKDGEVVWIDLSSSRIDYNGRPAVQGTFIDITERKKAEGEMQKREESFRTLMEDAPIGVCNSDLEGKITYVNKRFEEVIGYSREEIVGKNSFKSGIMSNETSKLLATQMKDRLMGKPSRVSEGRFKRKNGEWIWVEVDGRLIKKLGVPVGFLLTVKDITERKRAEEERKRFEESLSALNAYSRDLSMAKSMAEIYELTLEAAEKALGFEFADILVMKERTLCLATHLGYSRISSLELPLDGDKGITVRAARTGKPVFVPDISKEEAYVEGGLQTRSELAVPIKIGDKVVGVLNAERKEVNAFDEKDQQLLEILASHAATAISNLEYAKNLEASAQEIRESQQKFEGLFMANPEAAVHVGPDICILNVNPRFEMLFGYKLDEIKGKNINDVVVPEDRIDEARMLDRIAEQEKHVSQDTLRKRKDGSLVPVFVSSAPITVGGRFFGYVAVYKDISEVKNAEKKLELMNEKLRVTGGLTRHDARNKLSAVTGNVYLLKKLSTGNNDMLDKLKAIESAVQQTVRIFDFAKVYEMLGVEELSYVDVAKTLDEAVSLFTNSINVNILNECQGLVLLADPLLRQLFYNLADNSLKYGQKVTRIRVYYERASLDNLNLVYEDDGVGIAIAEKPKLFKQGYGTSGSTGYGLYLISKIVDVYGWIIQETGTPGKGAQFTIAIPKINRNGKENVRIS